MFEGVVAFWYALHLGFLRGVACSLRSTCFLRNLVEIRRWLVELCPGECCCESRSARLPLGGLGKLVPMRSSLDLQRLRIGRGALGSSAMTRLLGGFEVRPVGLAICWISLLRRSSSVRFVALACTCIVGHEPRFRFLGIRCMELFLLCFLGDGPCWSICG